MADPTPYTVNYSFSGYQAVNPSLPLPAPKLDAELVGISASIGSLLSSVKDVRRADGKLQNSLVTFDSLSQEILFLFNGGQVDNAQELANAVTSASGSATSAAASATAAQTAAAIATGAIDPTALFAGVIVPEVAVTAAATTDIGASSSAKVVINGTATITSFGTALKRLRIVRFNGACVLTHNATSLILLNARPGYTRTMAAGDQGIYLSDASGNWRELHFVRGTGALLGNPLFFAEHFTSVIGDGVADDMAALQAVIDLCNAAGGGRVVLTGGRTYRLVSNIGVTELGLSIKSNVTLDVNRATVNIECTGGVYGIRLQSDAHVVGPGTVATTVSVSPSSQSIYHTPISLGAASGEVTSVGALGNYINATRWSVRGLRVMSVRPGGVKIGGCGGISHGVIEDIYFPDDSTSVGCVHFDWSTVGTISSAAASMAANRIAFDGGTAYTVHPNNIDVRRLKIGVMTNAASCPIRMSGVHAIRFDGFEIAQSNAYSVFHTAGDLGYEFAPSGVKRWAHSGIVVRNGLIQSAANGVAVFWDNYADNVAAAISGFAYSAYLPAIAVTDMIVENINAIGNLTTGGNDGIQCFWMEGGTIRNCTMLGFLRGARFANGAKRVRLEGGSYNSSQQEGIYIGDTLTVPQEITIDGAWCYSNGISGSYAGVNAAAGSLHTIVNNRLGASLSGDSFQQIGVKVDATCVDVEVSGNNVLAAVTAYNIGSSNSYGCVRLFANNKYTAGIGTPYSGVDIVPTSFSESPVGITRRFLAARTAAAPAPALGTWLAGDTIEYSNPVASGYAGSKCVTGGSPGTWKNYGALTA